MLSRRRPTATVHTQPGRRRAAFRVFLGAFLLLPVLVPALGVGSAAAVTQGISGQATPASVTLGGAATDTATISGGLPSGSITFLLYAPGDSHCDGETVSTSTKATNGNGAYASDSYTPGAAGIYRWTARYVDDAAEIQYATVCNDPNQNVTVTAPAPSTTVLAGTASASVPAGGNVSDIVALTSPGEQTSPTGTISFSLFPPGNPSCAAPPLDYSTWPVEGYGTYGSNPYPAMTAGTYRFVASYSGDATHTAETTACSAPGQDVEVTAATPQITTTASGPVPAGGTISDTATLSGGANPTGTISFTVYGPGDATCTSPWSSSNRSVDGNGDYTSDAFTAYSPGTYRWTASYSGDANNAPVTGACNDPGENVDVTISMSLTNTPTPTSRAVPGGTFTFTAQVTNTSAVWLQLTSLVDDTYGNLDGQGTCSVPTAIAPDGGTYSCSFDGDFTGAAGASQTSTITATANANLPVRAHTTGTPSDPETATASAPATVTVTAVAVDLSGQASPTSVAMGGGPISDTATLSGGLTPTGGILFRLFGPGDIGCEGQPVFASDVVQVSDNGEYSSPDYTPTAVGTYRWVVNYSGDANNGSAATPCGGEGQNVTVTRAVTRLDTTAVASVPLGSGITDTAALSGGVNPTGRMAFLLFGPDDATCENHPVFVSQNDVDGNGQYASGSFVPDMPGTYRWVVGYSGDNNNDGFFGTCNEAGESSAVTISISLSNKPNITTREAPGGTFTFTATVTNTSTVALDLTSLVDSVYGDLDGKDTCNVPVVLSPDETYTCKFTGSFTGVAGDSQTNTITATASISGVGLTRTVASATFSQQVLAAAAATTVTATSRATIVLTPTLAVQPSAGAQGLPATGSDAGNLGLLGTSLLLAGAGALVATRGRRGRQNARSTTTG
jgi:hypothetical protein